MPRKSASAKAPVPAAPTTVDEYIAASRADVRPVLRKIRQVIRNAAPDAVEVISYGVPAFRQDDRILVYFAAFTHHIGLYPPVSDPALKKVVAPYAGPKGNLRFALDRPIPYPLIRRIVRSRLERNRARRTR